MAVMSDADRAECHGDFMRTPEAGEASPTLKAEERAVFDALDQFLSDNAAAINAAIPQPARTAWSTVKKARALTWVIRWRYLKGV